MKLVTYIVAFLGLSFSAHAADVLLITEGASVKLTQDISFLNSGNNLEEVTAIRSPELNGKSCQMYAWIPARTRVTVTSKNGKFKVAWGNLNTTLLLSKDETDLVVEISCTTKADGGAKYLGKASLDVQTVESLLPVKISIPGIRDLVI